MHLIRDIVDHRAEITQWRHDFHRHAELGHQEKRTAGRVAELLRSFGLDEVVEAGSPDRFPQEAPPSE